MRLEVKLQMFQIFGLWILLSGWGIFGLINIQNSSWDACLSNYSIRILRKLVVIFIIEDLVIAFLTILILPKVIWTILKIIYERFYIKILNMRQRQVHWQFWRKQIFKLQTKTYAKLDQEQAPNDIINEEMQKTAITQIQTEKEQSATSCQICS